MPNEGSESLKDKTHEKPLVIPELEEFLSMGFRPINNWTDDEVRILCRYYGRVPMKLLQKHIKRTENAIQKMAKKLELTHPQRAKFDVRDRFKDILKEFR